MTFRQVRDLNPGTNGSFPSNMVVFGDSLLFSAYTTNVGRELWNYDHQGITLISNINSTAKDILFGILIGNDSTPTDLTVFDNAVYFSSFDPMRGGELWRSDGTNAQRVADINPDMDDTIKTNPASSWPRQLTIVSNTLYFSANGGGQRANYELWKYEAGSVTLAADIHPASYLDSSSYPQGLTVFNGQLYFMADDGSNGYELWKHDGTSAVLLKNINPGLFTSSSYPKYFTPLNDGLYFQAYHSSYGYELWRTDGVNTDIVTNLAPGSSSSSPEHLTVFNGSLYFSATDGAMDNELWRYDGVSATLVSNINWSGSSYPKNLTVLKDILYFTADDGIHGWELWKWDGTTASLAADVNPIGDSYPESLTVFNGELYFVATTPATGYELWRYDGTNASLSADVNPGPGSSYPRDLAVFGWELCFSATEEGASNWELWALTLENIAPEISLTSPTSEDWFVAPASLALTAEAMDPDGSIRKVEFFEGTNKLGEVISAPFTFTWENVSAGAYSLWARASDNREAVTDSRPVTISITNAPGAPVRIENPAWVGSEFIFWFASETGRSYEVQFTPGPGQEWRSLTTLEGTGASVSVTNTHAAEAARLYRVITK